MGKFKPHKGLLKRIRITKSGKIKCRVANGSHLRSGKPAERLRNMRKARYLSSYGVLKRAKHLLGRNFKPATTNVEASRRQEIETTNVQPSKRQKVETTALKGE